MIRKCDDGDFEAVWSIVNDVAEADKGIVPQDRWKEPYMLVSPEEKGRLLRNYWSIPERQIETSVVLTVFSFRYRLC
jgi:hypothetical protein